MGNLTFNFNESFHLKSWILMARYALPFNSPTNKLAVWFFLVWPSRDMTWNMSMAHSEILWSPYSWDVCFVGFAGPKSIVNPESGKDTLEKNNKEWWTWSKPRDGSWFWQLVKGEINNDEDGSLLKMEERWCYIYLLLCWSKRQAPARPSDTPSVLPLLFAWCGSGSQGRREGCWSVGRWLKALLQPGPWRTLPGYPH